MQHELRGPVLAGAARLGSCGSSASSVWYRLLVQRAMEAAKCSLIWWAAAAARDVGCTRSRLQEQLETDAAGGNPRRLREQLDTQAASLRRMQLELNGTALADAARFGVGDCRSSAMRHGWLLAQRAMEAAKQLWIWWLRSRPEMGAALDAGCRSSWRRMLRGQPDTIAGTADMQAVSPSQTQPKLCWTAHAGAAQLR